MKKSPKLITAGILSLVEALFILYFPLFLLIVALTGASSLPRITIILYIITMVFCVYYIILLVSGALNAFKIRRWKLVLTSAIIAYLPFLFMPNFPIMQIVYDIAHFRFSRGDVWLAFLIPLIIPTINLVLIVTSRKEFVRVTNQE
jgi:hypothetical protein